MYYNAIYESISFQADNTEVLMQYFFDLQLLLVVLAACKILRKFMP